jgi:hypothetical protein
MAPMKTNWFLRLMARWKEKLKDKHRWGPGDVKQMCWHMLLVILVPLSIVVPVYVYNNLLPRYCSGPSVQSKPRYQRACPMDISSACVLDPVPLEYVDHPSLPADFKKNLHILHGLLQPILILHQAQTLDLKMDKLQAFLDVYIEPFDPDKAKAVKSVDQEAKSDPVRAALAQRFYQTRMRLSQLIQSLAALNSVHINFKIQKALKNLWFFQNFLSMGRALNSQDLQAINEDIEKDIENIQYEMNRKKEVWMKTDQVKKHLQAIEKEYQEMKCLRLSDL